MCYAQVETEMKMMQLRATRDQSEMRSMAQSAMDSQDVLGVARRGVASLDAIKESRANIAEIERKLVAILDAKPFGLPLTAQEKKDLETTKRDIADAEEADKKDKAKGKDALDETTAALMEVIEKAAKDKDFRKDPKHGIVGYRNWADAVLVHLWE